MTSIITHGIAAGAYLLLTVFLLTGWRRRGIGLALIATTALTALWAGIVAIGGVYPLPTALGPLSELARTGAWIVFLLLIRGLLARGDAAAHIWRDPLAAVGLALICVELIDVTAGAVASGWSPPVDVGLFTRLGLAVLGLLLVENLFMQTREGARWAFKHLLIGVGALFAFDLFLYSQALLFKKADPVIVDARPLVNTAIVPFILVAAVRIRNLAFNVAVSRTAVLQTTALIGSGLYLLAVAGIGFLMREMNLTWGPVLQILFFSGAAMVLVVLLLSGELRARVKMFIAQNFFTFAYDYRQEWLRFIRTMSSDDIRITSSSDDGGTLYNRAIQAVADVFECSAGALYLRGRGDIYALAGRRDWGSAASCVALPTALAEQMERRDAVLDLRGGVAVESDDAKADAVMAWVRALEDPWLLIPLRARGQIVGAIVLGQPRAPRKLNWEDEDLLDILAVQIGSYIAEEQAIRALIEAQRFERLSKRFSFVAHDLKNLVSQLSLVLHHAERHGNNPEFQQDVLETVRGSVAKMQTMLTRLREGADSEPTGETVEIGALLSELLERKKVLRDVAWGGTIEDGARVTADRMALSGVLDNLIQNAIEAVGTGGRVEIDCRARRGDAVIEIRDNGPGMTQAFIEQNLFTPFTSTKSSGFGIGMYQTRELAESWGGRVEIESQVGVGTTIRLILPLAAAHPISVSVETDTQRERTQREKAPREKALGRTEQ
ncbi:XrtA/PEP-CTERM system histidine kinase PrsK [Rhodospirillaceae bacterium SYSU D60014]|uniref:XrtA/PEP-CTERM system histidine kinase PrsK n=1 Tax=Virgifigura deserti TaxID=2268457 RepID=UPI000E666F9D